MAAPSIPAAFDRNSGLSIMTYREKTVWLTFVAMIIAYTLYFGFVLSGHPAGREIFPMLWLFGSIAGTQAVVVIIGYIILTLTTPKAERQRPDERDSAIRRRGATVAYYVLMAGTVIVGVGMPFSYSGVTIANAALFAIVLAEVVNDAIVLISYRRGWHG